MRALHKDFGVEIRGMDLREAAVHFPQIREAFEDHSLLLFRNQYLNEEAHLAFGRLFGTIEIREKQPENHEDRVSIVSNRREDGCLEDEGSARFMHQRANQLWHTDSTFLPRPALANILTARVIPSSGGATQFVSTRAAWRDLPEKIREKTRNLIFLHRYAHSRKAVSESAANLDIVTMWPDTKWRAIWRNPVNGTESLYLASHAYGVDGMDEQEGRLLINELIEFSTEPHRVYSHQWLPGDVLVWDERATMHRGTSWPYGEERTLASICITASEFDGLDQTLLN
ncbi:MAG: TauD/TfdA family dioxygenase [Gammaproteobacteria bacterium]|nr:TauD/TfdA family dioxygenase [Gammaproteobacteria bacterium]